MRRHQAQPRCHVRRAALGTVGAGALIVTAACGTNDDVRVRAMGYDGGLAQQMRAALEELRAATAALT